MKPTKNWLYLILAILLMSSCITRRNTVILKGANELGVDSIRIAENSKPYEIQVGDFIQLNVINPDKESVSVFQKRSQGVQMQTGSRASSLHMFAYMVDNDSTMKIPLLGKYPVVGKTIIELEEELEENLKAYFKFVTVEANLVDFKVTFIGEVGTQGTVELTNERTNFFEVLSQAGGLTDFSNTHNVKILRQKNDYVTVNYVDISGVDFVNSEFYFLRPDDIVYVEPIRGKNFRTNIGLITTTISVFTLIFSLSRSWN